MFPLKTLGEVAKIIRGITFKPDDVISPNDENAVVCFRTKNIQQSLDENDLIAVPPRFVNREDQSVRNGDILVSSANSWNLVGKCCYVPALTYKATAGGFISILRGDSQKVDSRYLYHWFSSPDVQTLLRSFGRKTTNISNLNIKLTLQAKIPLPPLSEQKRIAEALDKADTLREKRRLALQKLDTLLKSVFLEMFGDPVTNPKGWTLSTFGHELISLQYGPRFYNQTYSQDGTRIIRITDLESNGNLDFDAMPKLEVSEEDIKKYSLKTGDIIFARSGATVGKTALISENAPVCIAGAYFLVLRLNNKFNPLFVRTVLSQKSIQQIIVSQSRQSAQQNFSGPGLRRLPLPIPPTEMQESFAAKDQKIRQTQSTNANSLSKLENLFQTLQQRAFKGELFSNESLAVKPQEEVWQLTSPS